MEISVGTYSIIRGPDPLLGVSVNRESTVYLLITVQDKITGILYVRCAIVFSL